MIIPAWFIAACVLVPPLPMVLLGCGLFSLASRLGTPGTANWCLLVPVPVALVLLLVFVGPDSPAFLLGWVGAWSLLMVVGYLLLGWLTGRTAFGSNRP